MTTVHEHLRALIDAGAERLGTAAIRGAGGGTFVTEKEARRLLDAGGVPSAATAERVAETRGALTEDLRAGEESRVAALELSPLAARWLAVEAVVGRDPHLHQVLLSLSGDPVVKTQTVLARAELLAGGDAELGRQHLAEFLPGGAATSTRADGGGVPGGARGAKPLAPELARYLAGEAPALIWSDATTTGALITDDTDPPSWVVDDAQVRVLRDGLRHAARAKAPLRVLVSGADGAMVRHLVCQQVLATGQALLTLDAAAFPDEGAVLPVLRTACRDARIHDAVLYIGGFERVLETAGRWQTAVARQLQSHSGPFVLGASRRAPALWQQVEGLVQVDLPLATNQRQVEALSGALGGGDAVREVAERVGPRFTLDQETIEAATRQARATAEAGTITSTGLSRAIRRQLETRLGEFADVVTTGQGLSDLELDGVGKDTITEMIAAYAKRDLILETWGFGSKIRNARGVSALFYGPPGTGKTMAAGIIARELGTDLYKVDLSRVVDKYIGETEKHLGRIFDEAERGQVVLLFDEADSLFSERTEVSRSTDRYANLEVNFLLQRLEHHEGIVVLTTNHDALIDPAFKRRIRYRVHFPMPEEGARARLWEGLIPGGAPVDDGIDFEHLGERYEMSGGHIRNAILRAAFSCADRGINLGEDALIQAANVEYRAMGKIVRRMEGDPE